MKIILTIFFLCIGVVYVKADYSALKLYEMILGAEKIVYGEIIALSATTYTLNIEQNLTGKEDKLVIKRFKDWPCAQRWGEYQMGQKLFLFIKNHKGEFYTMSGGNEGELPIYNSSVYIPYLSLDPPPPPMPNDKTNNYSKNYFLKCQENKIYGKNYYSYKMDIKSFIETVLLIRNCFKIQYSKYNSIEKANIICNKEALDDEIKTNKIFNWTYHKLKSIAETNKP